MHFYFLFYWRVWLSFHFCFFFIIIFACVFSCIFRYFVSRIHGHSYFQLIKRDVASSFFPPFLIACMDYAKWFDIVFGSNIINERDYNNWDNFTLFNKSSRHIFKSIKIHSFTIMWCSRNNSVSLELGFFSDKIRSDLGTETIGLVAFAWMQQMS